MEQKEVFKLLKETGIATTYAEWPQGSEMIDPNIVFIHDDYVNFKADNYVYHTDNRWLIELYSKVKDLKSEELLIEVFNQNKIVWQKVNETRISEELYQVVFLI